MRKIEVSLDGKSYTVQLNADPADRSRFVAEIDGEELPVYVPNPADPGMLEWMVINSRPYEIMLSEHMEWLTSSGGMHELDVHWLGGAEGAVARPSSGDGRVKAPIPGLIARILVEEGAMVEAGAPVLVLEAMKMENEIRAPAAARCWLLLPKPARL